MSEKATDNSAVGCLILIFPIAFVIIFLFATWPVLLALLVLSAIWNVGQRYQWQKWSQQVNPIFHKLIQENRGSITALDLAMKAGFSAATAQRYLDVKAAEFGAQRLVYEDRGTVYYFITARTLGSIFDESEPPSQSSQEDVEQAEPPEQKQSPLKFLIQSELAKRFDVHSSTVYKHRDDPSFAEWSRTRDPEGIAWKYLPETKQFSPLEEESS